MPKWFREKVFLIGVGVFFVLAQVSFAHHEHGEKEEKKTVEKKTEKIFELDEIVVTATPVEKALCDVPIKISLITKKEIENSNAQNIADLVKYIPAMGTGFGIGGGDRPGRLDCRATFRGLDLDRGYGLTLVDGQRIRGSGPSEAAYGINHIPAQMIERIEVVKGPASVLYGSDVMAGVINIITKPLPEKRFFSFYGGYGTYDELNAGLAIGDKIGNFGYILNSAKQDSKGEYRSNFVNTKLGYEFKKSKINLGISWDEKSWRVPRWRCADVEGIRISPGYEVKFDDGSKFSLKGYWCNWNFHHFTPNFAEVKGDIGYYQAESQYSRLLLDKHMLTAGFEFLQEEMEHTLVDKTINTYSLFLQDEWQALNNLNLVLGVRFDSHSQFGQKFIPRVSGLFEITDKTRLRVSIGRSFKPPTIRELYYNAPSRDRMVYIRPNPNLKPEYGMGYSLGLEHEFRDRLLFNVGIFRNDVDNMVIISHRIGTYRGRALFALKNIEGAYTQGIELELKAQITKELAGFLSYAFLDTENKETKKELPFRPNHTAGLRLNYDNKKYGVGTNFGLRYVSSMYQLPLTLPKTDDYFVFEIKFIKEITKYANISFEIDNLFETDYGNPAFKREGRTYMGKVNLKF